MLKKILFSSLCLVVIFSFTLPVSAASKLGKLGLDQTGQEAGYSSTDTSSGALYSYLRIGINIILSLLAIIFIGVMFYGGLRWMTARGNDELITKAKDAIIAGIIGIILIISSYAIATFVLGQVGVLNTYNTSNGNGPVNVPNTNNPNGNVSACVQAGGTCYYDLPNQWGSFVCPNGKTEDTKGSSSCTAGNHGTCCK